MITNSEAFVYKTVLYAGEIMVRSGSETYRAEDTMKRMLSSVGIENVSTFVSPTVIILGDNTKDGSCFIQNIDKRSTNLAKIENVNNLSRDFVAKKINVEEAYAKLKEIASAPSYPYILAVLGCALGCAIFSVLIGGNLSDFISALITSAITFHTNEVIAKVSNTQFLGYFACALAVTFVSVGLSKLGLGQNLDSIVVGSILPLVPGVALTTGVRDFMNGDLLSGVARIMEAATIAVAIAFGVGFSLTFLHLVGVSL
ncbi:MAG: threonine/serine exporter family protein [Ezakiella sp.]|nr:threonine/serine exporter family protein [Ezakiella sp.]